MARGGSLSGEPGQAWAGRAAGPASLGKGPRVPEEMGRCGWGWGVGSRGRLGAGEGPEPEEWHGALWGPGVGAGESWRDTPSDCFRQPGFARLVKGAPGLTGGERVPLRCSPWTGALRCLSNSCRAWKGLRAVPSPALHRRCHTGWGLCQSPYPAPQPEATWVPRAVAAQSTPGSMLPPGPRQEG